MSETPERRPKPHLRSTASAVAWLQPAGQGGLLKFWEVAALVAITFLAAALRFYRLPDLPPGLHFDEAFKGVTARDLLNGAPPRLFFESDMGEEPVAAYLVAAALALVGPVPWAIRLPSAIVGTLTVPLAWWLGRELVALLRSGRPVAGPVDGAPSAGAGIQGPITGLGTALILAILYWHLSFSRIGMEPILVPFFATLAFAALARGLNTGRWPAFVLAGLALGGSLYTYKAGYFVPLLAMAWVACAAAVERDFLRRHGRGLLLVTLVALLVVAPITLYFATHPANFLQRPVSVAVGGRTVAGGPWQAVVQNLPRVLGMFFLRGDANPRSNLPGRPALDPFLAVLFLVGLGGALRHLRRPAALLPPLWVVVMALPTLLTDDAPHFGRAIGATPAVALLCAQGGWASWRAATRLNRRGVRLTVTGLLAAGLAFSTALTARAYFVTWGRCPDLFHAYDVGLARVAVHVATLPAGEEVYLTPTSHDHYTLQFLVHRPLASFDGRAGLVYPAPGRAATVVVLLREDDRTLPALQRTRPDGAIAWTLADGYGRPYAVAYHLPASSTPAPTPGRPVDATFAGAARLLGYSLDREAIAPGESLELTLFWQALVPLPQDYTAFVHLLGDYNPATKGPVWAGHDNQPDAGRYPTATWQPGEVILDVHPLAVPADAPPGDYSIEAGLYLLATLERLPAISSDGQPLPGNVAVLGTIHVGR